MLVTLEIGKNYHLEFSDENADVEDYLQGLKALSTEYKFVAHGMIPWGHEDLDKCEKYEYYLFEKNEKIVEVFISNERYMSLVFYSSYSSKLTTGKYSDYLEYGELDFPEFSGNNDICVNVDITQI
jgi:hypothetical protein